ncbi:polysaccharide deacetylase family protein [Paeniclostridium hominis]|uniref:polysaccharide deacetylase family protein n=1 Tax=Paeniclostridium hominis TaxID=2764329 RepID=UPI0022E34D4D|nr:polysaccharide deacetylase family protein [Paeniclostridium hominis]
MRKLIIPIVSIFLLISIIYGINTSDISGLDDHQSAMINNKNIIKQYEDIVITKGNETKKTIALTFDDGPDQDFSPQILDILKKYNVKATFFMVGQKVGWNPKIAKRASDEGHDIGNHTFSHINICKSTNEQIINEINKTQKIIKDVTGKEATLFRPPYRAINENLFNIIKSKDMKVVLWSDLDTKDWSNPGVYNIIKTIEENAKNGTIILLHDYNQIRNNKSQTIQALEKVIPKMQSLGYEFVTISDMIK